MVKNLAITGRRKLPRRAVYVEVEPRLIELGKVLSELSLSREELIDVGILIGTDLNPDGVKGIGPKTALKLIHEHHSLDALKSKEPAMSALSDVDSIRQIFLKPDVTPSYHLKWSEPNVERVVQFLCREHDFSEERVRKAVSRMTKPNATVKSTLESYF